jgi:hypothetical protein
MSALNQASADTITRWGTDTGNPAAATALIAAAGQSPYLASQFNKLKGPGWNY